MKIVKDDDNFIYFWVGKNVAKYRKLKKWRQSDLADACNFTDTFIANIENNTFQTFSLNTLSLIAKKLEIHPRQLLDDLEDTAPNS